MMVMKRLLLNWDRCALRNWTALLKASQGRLPCLAGGRGGRGLRSVPMDRNGQSPGHGDKIMKTAAANESRRHIVLRIFRYHCR